MEAYNFKEGLLGEISSALNPYALMIHALLNTTINQEKIAEKQRLFLKKEQEQSQYVENQLLQEELATKESCEFLIEIIRIKEKLFSLMMQDYNEKNLKVKNSIHTHLFSTSNILTSMQNAKNSAIFENTILKLPNTQEKKSIRLVSMYHKTGKKLKQDAVFHSNHNTPTPKPRL